MSVPDHILNGIADSVDEMLRLETLSDQDLIREYLTLGDRDSELHVNEMMNRLWPQWDESEEAAEKLLGEIFDEL